MTSYYITAEPLVRAPTTCCATVHRLNDKSSKTRPPAVGRHLKHALRSFLLAHASPLLCGCPHQQIDGIMARIATKGLFQPDMEKLFSDADREAVGREFEGWVMENFTKEGGAGVRLLVQGVLRGQGGGVVSVGTLPRMRPLLAQP